MLTFLIPYISKATIHRQYLAQGHRAQPNSYSTNHHLAHFSLQTIKSFHRTLHKHFSHGVPPHTVFSPSSSPKGTSISLHREHHRRSRLHAGYTQQTSLQFRVFYLTSRVLSLSYRNPIPPSTQTVPSHSQALPREPKVCPLLSP